ncbi:MAG: hypothetical protein IPM79_13285 [Polyangiaceae bacterium]|jgi:hypothetical protein|nr:hypothetical protein [Polyangiaceae bacterium]MBK8938573.1 hypothetical protein [Polyangiaceae bacterium]
MHSLAYRRVFGGVTVTFFALVFPAMSALSGGCGISGQDDGYEDKDGVKNVPPPNMTGPGGPGSGGFGEGGGSTGTGQPCLQVSDCDDFDLCTTEACTDNVCVQTDPADDNDACTDDTCDAETGDIFHTVINPDDGDPCTFDLCDPASGVSNPTVVPLLTEDFTDASPGWVTTGTFEIGPAAVSEPCFGGTTDPGTDTSAAGDDVAGTAIGVRIESVGVSSLESPGISLGALQTTESVTLRYQRWLNTDPNTTASVYAFDCNLNQFMAVWNSSDVVTDDPVGVPSGTGWFQVRHDVTTYAQGCKLAGEQFKVRFEMNITAAEFPGVAGWNIDDVQVIRTKVPADTLICTSDICIDNNGTAVADHPLINIDDGLDATTFACSEGNGPSQVD